MPPGPDLQLTGIAQEPLCVIAPLGTELPADPLTALPGLPFIGFSRATWLGAQIAALLHPLGIALSIELDSLDAVENLVTRGFGASIVPQRLYASPLSENMACAQLPGAARHLTFAAHASDDRATVRAAMAQFARGASA